MSAPPNEKELRKRIDAAAARRSVAPGRLHYTVASTIALQMVPPGAAKGGGGVRQRVDERAARLTNDLDFARPSAMSLNDFVDAFADRLEAGWADFTGIVKAGRKATPEAVPDEYVMDPFRIALRYRGKSYYSVTFELGHSEIGSGDRPVERLGTDIAEIFAEVGLPEPMPVPVITAEDQIVQKIHACTCPTADGRPNERAHDLVDIQILAAVEDLDYAVIADLGARLFAYRRRHEWPPDLIVHEGWESLYAQARADLVDSTVLDDVNDAADFVRQIIGRAAGTQRTS
ncbi:MAG TPA: nucleotidyl transferase AbiEii/AbiGii toxin family protein [Ilumatobacteraceae bacterium]|nr:nucleotidyl transferase AbiEii/AbiGii toxin family protein [Ilumatobacteraceae bacterium]HRB02263.1 nucleotidyl transferase AbiEii/AbiGii toxin family protein [Ilumatobacteraceae bacterium]